MDTKRAHTFQLQSDLATFCRTGDYIKIPGVNEENVIQYRNLMYNVIDDSLISTFPLVKKILKTKKWDALVHDFVKNHPCSSPQVWNMPKEFYQYIIDFQPKLLQKKPFLQELLWFDWLELEMFMMEDKVANFTPDGNIFKDKLVINPEINLQHFTYPVFHKKPKKLKADKVGDYYIVFYRKPETGYVNYWELPPIYIRLLEVLGDKPMKIKKVLQQVCDEIGVKLSKEVENMGFAFIEECLERDIILGFESK